MQNQYDKLLDNLSKYKLNEKQKTNIIVYLSAQITGLYLELQDKDMDWSNYWIDLDTPEVKNFVNELCDYTICSKSDSEEIIDLDIEIIAKLKKGEL